MTIPRRLGEILTDAFTQPVSPARWRGPKWRRTGGGRRANVHVRIDTADAAWESLHRDAIHRGMTVARRVGLAVER